MSCECSGDYNHRKTEGTQKAKKPQRAAGARYFKVLANMSTNTIFLKVYASTITYKVHACEYMHMNTCTQTYIKYILKLSASATAIMLRQPSDSSLPLGQRIVFPKASKYRKLINYVILNQQGHNKEDKGRKVGNW